MYIKEFEYIEDRINNHLMYFIKNPNENIVFDDDEDRKFFLLI